MKVICAGMPKTGTKSLHVALEMLGYSVHDFPDAFDHFETEYHSFAVKGWKESDFYGMYKNIDAVVDSPAFYFWEELLEAFPEAKVVLSIRDGEETWYKSFRNQITSININKRNLYIYQLLSPIWRRFVGFSTNTGWICFDGRQYHGFETKYPDPPNISYKQAYRRHNAHVIRNCPRDRLLVFNCKSGWKPLCEFLGKQAPAVPFPRINVKGKLSNMIWELDVAKRARRDVKIRVGIILALSLGLSFSLFVHRDRFILF